MGREGRALRVGIGYAGFVLLGLSGGLLGVGWPSIRGTFSLSLDAVGVLMVASTAGYLLSSFLSGPLGSRFGRGRHLMVSSLLAGAGLLGCGLAPAWWIMVLSGFLQGLGGGAIDAGTNAYFATNHSASLMNWLHASYGLGATLGPLVLTSLFSVGGSWRWGYAAAGALQGLFAVCFGLTRGGWGLAGAGAGASADLDAPADQARTGETLRLPAVWLGVALFFLFAGTEGAAGQWPYTLFTEGRSVAPSVAGVWVSVYWGSLMVGRILFGLVVDRLGVVPTVRACMLGAIVGAAALWWNVTDLLSFLGMASIGFWLAPLFPLLISHTPRRVGAAHASNAIGFQVAAASLSFAVLPGLAGVLAENWGLEVISPFLLFCSVAMLLLHELSVRRGARRSA